jgi:hypothetical protein
MNENDMGGGMRGDRGMQIAYKILFGKTKGKISTEELKVDGRVYCTAGYFNCFFVLVKNNFLVVPNGQETAPSNAFEK